MDLMEFIIIGKKKKKTMSKKKILSKKSIKPMKKYGGGGIMLWGCFGWNGTGWACFITGKMNKDLYLEILQGEMLDSIKFCIPETKNFILCDS